MEMNGKWKETSVRKKAVGKLKKCFCSIYGSLKTLWYNQSLMSFVTKIKRVQIFIKCTKTNA